MSECGCSGPVSILCTTNHPTIQYAAEELKKYLPQITQNKNFNLEIGLMTDFPQIEIPKVPDPAWDDAIDIEVSDGKGIIAGMNYRSVLQATYRYLTELGCRWVRPGSDGEVLPTLSDIPSVCVKETASYRHRGVCIEGGVSIDHIRDILEWMPKVGFNAYFMQFREAFTFFDRWYSHLDNPYMEPQKFTREDSQKFTQIAVDEVKKRDFIYHAVGHGWTCEPFGIHAESWDKQTEQVPESISQYFAEVNGERKLFGDVAINTNLCYSNPEVRRIMIEDITRYAENHPEVDLLHLWLADGVNNNCECAECTKARPADFYVKLLNELDEALTKKGIKTKIVFLIYVDLLWPPLYESIHNPDRFVMMFAPIIRTYSQAFTATEDLPKLPEYVRNKLEFPSGVPENLAFLRAWQKIFKGESFDFDYHLMWDHFRDPGYMQILDVIWKDMKGLRGIGLNGYISCQPNRLFFPTALPMVLMAKTLWNTEVDKEAVIQDYFQSAFGADGNLCRDYLQMLSDLFDPVYLRDEKPAKDSKAEDNFKKIPGIIDAFLPIIERNMNSDVPCHAKSWFYLKEHAELWKKMAAIFAVRAQGKQDEAVKMWKDMKEYVRKKEAVLHPVLDVWEFNNSTFHWMFSNENMV